MKNKITKFLIWVLLGVTSLYFVVFRQGVVNLDFTAPQIITLVYAVFMALAWGLYRKFNSRSSSYLLAVLLYASVGVIMTINRFFLSPTELVALIALFYYSSKIFTFSFKK